ncbi:MAG: DUF2892 domain-containing protein [Steroidobacteraceae bacterium]
MKANVGGIDKTLRIIVGLIVLALYFVIEGPAKNWALLGLVPLLTGVLNFCPLYTLLGINTCPMNKT